MRDFYSDILAGCVGKSSFDTYSIASSSSERMLSRGRKAFVYRCRFCHKFHIGQRPRHRPPYKRIAMNWTSLEFF